MDLGYVQQTKEDSEDVAVPSSYTSAMTYSSPSAVNSTVQSYYDPSMQMPPLSSTTVDRDNIETVEEEKEGLLLLPASLNASSLKFKWNSDFQTYFSALKNPALSEKDRISALNRISSLAINFLRTAMFYGKIIISERYLEDEAKSIKPVDIGGVAGGTKYICQGILFKFAVDAELIYGGDIYAMKGAAHDLKGSQAVLRNSDPDIHVPLMAIIDFKGMRLLAISLLPLESSTTLLYGSSDAGRTIHRDNSPINEKIESLAQKLNLKEHIVNSTGTKMSFPADIEAHKGKDNRIYLIDFARMFPAEPPPPSENTRRSHLSYRLREELITKWKNPLCSDAFSGFQKHDPKHSEHNKEVREAFAHLITVIIPNFAHWLDEQPTSTPTTPNAAPFVSTTIETMQFNKEMHKRGINMRHLGKVWKHVGSQEWKKKLLTEMVLRVCKATLRALMRRVMKESRLATDEPYIRVIIDYFNLVFGNSTDSANYWNNELTKNVAAIFFYLDNPPPTFENLKQQVHLSHMLKRLAEVSGVKLQQAYLSNSFDLVLNLEQVIEEEDVLSIYPIAKHLFVLNNAQAFYNYTKGCCTVQTDTRNHTFEVAIKHFENSVEYIVEGSSSSLFTFRYWCKTLIESSMNQFYHALPKITQFARDIANNIATKKIRIEREMEHYFLTDLLALLCRYFSKKGKPSYAIPVNELLHPAVFALLCTRGTKERKTLAEYEEYCLDAHTLDLNDAGPLATETTLYKLLDLCPKVQHLHLRRILPVITYEQLRVIVKKVNVVSLYMNGHKHSTETFELLSTHCPDLENLTLYGTTFTADSVMKLEGCKKLKSLSASVYSNISALLQSCPIEDLNLENYRDSDKLASDTLKSYNWWVSEGKIQPFLNNCPSVVNLKLNGPSEDDLKLLFQRPPLQQLVLRNSKGISAEIMAMLGKFHGATIQFLDLNTCNINDECLAAITKHFSCITSLDISDNQQITPVGLGHVAKLKGLLSLTLETDKPNVLTDDALSELSQLSNLQLLSINALSISADALAQFLSICTSLQVLKIDRITNKWNDVHIALISKCPKFQSLSLTDWQDRSTNSHAELSKCKLLRSIHLYLYNRKLQQEFQGLESGKNILEITRGTTEFGLCGGFGGSSFYVPNSEGGDYSYPFGDRSVYGAMFYPTTIITTLNNIFFS